MARVTGREAIDVEELVTRAYRDQCVDRITSAGLLGLRMPSISGVSSTALIMGHLSLGTAVDTSTSGANFAGRAGMMQAVADDYVDLHDAALRLPRFYADLTGGLGFMVWDDRSLVRAPLCGFDVIGDPFVDRPSLRIATRRHDAAPPAGPRGYRNGVPLMATHAEAEAAGEAGACALYPRERVVHQPSRPLHLIEPAVLLVTCGRAGARPDVSPVVVERHRPRYAGKRKVVGHDPVYETALATIALQRAAYAVWHCALVMLAEQLGDLARFRVSGPEASAAPWEAEAMAGARVHVADGVALADSPSD